MLLWHSAYVTTIYSQPWSGTTYKEQYWYVKFGDNCCRIHLSQCLWYCETITYLKQRSWYQMLHTVFPTVPLDSFSYKSTYINNYWFQVSCVSNNTILYKHVTHMHNIQQLSLDPWFIYYYVHSKLYNAKCNEYNIHCTRRNLPHTTVQVFLIRPWMKESSSGI